MKIKFIVIVFALVFVLASCSKVPSVIEIELFDGSTVEVSTDGLSDEQIEALQEAAESGSTQSLMASGLFTMDELSALGLSMGGGMGNQPGGGGMQGGGQPDGDIAQNIDFSDVDINDLDTSSLSEEQIEALTQLIAGEVTLDDVIAAGTFTMEDLQSLGLMTGGVDFAGEGFEAGMMQDADYSDVDINDLDTEGLSDEQIEALNQLIAGEVSLDDLINDGLFTMEDLQTIGLMNGFSGMDGSREEGGTPPDGGDTPEDGATPPEDGGN